MVTRLAADRVSIDYGEHPIVQDLTRTILDCGGSGAMVSASSGVVRMAARRSQSRGASPAWPGSSSKPAMKASAACSTAMGVHTCALGDGWDCISALVYETEADYAEWHSRVKAKFQLIFSLGV